MLPEGWKLKSLKQIGECISGLTYSPDNITDKENDGLLVLRSSNIKNGSIVLEDNVYVDCCIDDAKLTRLKDILICVRNGSKTLIGKSAIITNPAAIGQAHGAFMSVFRSESNEYVFQLFQTSMFFRQVSADLGATINSINTNNLLKYKFPFPPLPEQKKIAQILSTWDNAISATERLLENSQQRKKALMQQLLTGKKRLLDKNGGRFSGEWKDIRLKSVLREVKTRNKDNSIDRVLSVTNHSGFVLPEDQFSKRVASDDVSNYKVVKKGEYGYNPSRLNVGSFARLDSYEEGLLSPMYVVFSVNEKFLNSDYFMNWMSSNEAKQRISGSTQGSVRDSVGFDSLCGFPFKLPPMAEQQKIAAVLSTTDQEISALQQKLDALKQEKKALMQQFLTGKRRVTLN